MAIEIKISDELDDTRWDEFVAQNHFSQHEQTSGFARSRARVYSVFHILLLERNEIIGGSQVFVLSTRIGKIAEIRHGPLFNRENVHLVNKFVDALIMEAEKRNLVKIKVFSLGGNTFVEHALQQLNFQRNEFRNSLGSTVVVDLVSTEDEIFARMKRKTRYNIRYASKKGISVEVGGRTNIKEFYDMYKQISDLKDFPIFPIDYFYYLWDLYSKTEKIYLLVARSDDVPLATMILIPFGNMLCRLWFSAARSKPDSKAGYLLDWEAILMAKKLGYREYDLCGADQNNTSGYAEYKRNFGGAEYHYPDSLEYYFGMFPNFKRKFTNQIWKVNIVRKMANRYLHKDLPRLPF